jgi:hypothetical protein
MIYKVFKKVQSLPGAMTGARPLAKIIIINAEHFLA